MNAQLRLPLTRAPDYSRDRFALSAANAPALAMLDVFKAGALATVGPEGCGKTHLARMWADQVGAMVLTEPPADYAALAGLSLVIEDADGWPDAEALFHLLNMTQASGALLLTSRLAPSAWPCALPDLRSRLAGLVIAQLHEPDDAVLAAVLTRLFDERHIRPTRDVIPYLLYRMERSIPHARRLVEQLDEAAASRGREINRALAIEVLDAGGDLFDRL